MFDPVYHGLWDRVGILTPLIHDLAVLLPGLLAIENPAIFQVDGIREGRMPEGRMDEDGKDNSRKKAHSRGF